jgi:hypothetical protein
VGAFVFAVALDARLRPCLGWWLARAPGDEQRDHDRSPHRTLRVATNVLGAAPRIAFEIAHGVSDFRDFGEPMT